MYFLLWYVGSGQEHPTHYYLSQVLGKKYVSRRSSTCNPPNLQIVIIESAVDGLIPLQRLVR